MPHTTEFIVSRPLADKLIKSKNVKVIEHINYNHNDENNFIIPYSVLHTKLIFKSKNSQIYKNTKADLVNMEGFQEYELYIEFKKHYVIIAQKSLKYYNWPKN